MAMFKQQQILYSLAHVEWGCPGLEARPARLEQLTTLCIPKGLRIEMEA